MTITSCPQSAASRRRDVAARTLVLLFGLIATTALGGAALAHPDHQKGNSSAYSTSHDHSGSAQH